MIDASAPTFQFGALDSTMAEARRRLDAGDAGPCWIVAEEQGAGRGRRGRSWASLHGNLMATYLGATSHGPAEIAKLGFAAGLAIAETLDHALGGASRAKLKWPNDVLLDGAKISGLLIDCGGLKSGGHWFALGIGVNLAAAPEGLDQPTASLRAALPPDAPAPAPRDFLVRLATRLAFWTDKLEREGFEPVRGAWLMRAAGLGERVKVSLGAETLEGRFAGLTQSGELELDAADGRRLIAAGDVIFAGASHAA